MSNDIFARFGMMRRLFFAFLFSSMASLSLGATYYTTGSGEFTTDAIWGTSTSGAGSLWSTISLMDGDTIVIDDNVEISSSDLTINEEIVILLKAEIELVKKVYLDENKRPVLHLSPGGQHLHVSGKTRSCRYDQPQSGRGNCLSQ